MRIDAELHQRPEYAGLSSSPDSRVPTPNAQLARDAAGNPGTEPEGDHISQRHPHRQTAKLASVNLPRFPPHYARDTTRRSTAAKEKRTRMTRCTKP